MTARERIEGYRALCLDIKHKREKVARLRAKAEYNRGGARYEVASVQELDGAVSITYTPKATEAQEVVRPHDPFGDAVAELADEKAVLEGLLQIRRRELKAMSRIIASLPSSDRKLIRLRYVKGWSWARIEKSTGFSVQTLKNRNSEILWNL